LHLQTASSHQDNHRLAGLALTACHYLASPPKPPMRHFKVTTEERSLLLPRIPWRASAKNL